MPKCWLPLEANPEILTEYSYKLGMPTELAFHDILGTEDWALDMLPKPIYGIVLLFPISEASEVERKRTPCATGSDVSYFMHQTVGNACGTIAVLHALANLDKTGTVKCSRESYVARMIQLTNSMTPEERGKWLERDPDIELKHLETESMGQSAAPTDMNVEIDTHFIAFVMGLDGQTVYELDGRRTGPVARATCDSQQDFGSRVLHVIKTEYMDRNPSDIRFSLLALSSKE